MIVNDDKGNPIAELTRVYNLKHGDVLKICQNRTQYILVPLNAATLLADAIHDAVEAIAAQT